MITHLIDRHRLQGIHKKELAAAPVDRHSGGAGNRHLTAIMSKNQPMTDKSWIVIGSIFLLIILGAFAYGFVGPHNQAQVFLETSARSPNQLSGTVLFKGAPVSEGTVHLVLEDPKKDRYLASAILPVREGGKFATSGNESLVFAGSNKKPQPLRVTATFSGQERGEKKDKAPTRLQGNATLYLNYPPPAEKWVTWGSFIIAALLGIALIILFTDGLKRCKARQLFSITYMMCFVSLSVPIWAIAVVSKSEHAVDIMEQAPVGLIKGTAKNIERPQWLVNVGGAVVPAQEVPTKEETGASPAKVEPAKEPETGRLSPVDAPTATSSATPQRSRTPQENTALDEPRQVPGFALVRGGLAVPFYVIILAMLGAGINMTKKVPDIQKTYNCSVLPRLRKQGRIDPEQAAAISEIRKELIDNYMALISAPFLAIAVYYLLQVAAANVAEPVIVVVSFATGFISHKIITAITAFASKTIRGGEQEKPKEEGSGKPKTKNQTRQKSGNQTRQKRGLQSQNGASRE